MTAEERLKSMQERLAKLESEFFLLRPKTSGKPDPALAHKLDGIAQEIRRIRLEIDALLGMPPAGKAYGRPIKPPLGRVKPVGVPRPGQPPRGRAPGWRKGN